jgi:hypothetical protein
VVRYNKATNQKLHKEFCEIEGCKAHKETLNWHHIVERTEIDTSNNPYNIAIICSNCHALVHAGVIEIIGVYPSTNKYGRKLIYKRGGVSNVEGINEPYFKPTPKQSRLDYLYEKEEEKSK